MLEHQITNSIGGDIYNGWTYRNIRWNTHFHNSYEFMIVTQGRGFATVDGKEYSLKKGDCLLIFPYQVHSYSSDEGSISFVAVFSKTFVDAFNKKTQGKESSSPLFSLDNETFDYIAKNLMNGNTAPERTVRNERPATLVLKACLYSVCAQFEKSAQFIKKSKDSSLTFEILQYIEENFTQDISLSTMAVALGYDYEYLSRIFNRNFSVGLKTLINQYRCEKAVKLIKSTDSTLAEIAMASGFQSIRSFNRVFKEIVGVSPSEIKHS